MPWKEKTPVDQRMRFIGALSTCRWTMSELCRLYGISRKTGYKWARRYGEEGFDGLKDRSRRPASCPHQTDERCEAALVEERRKHPTWGAKKLLTRLRPRHPDWPWPAVSTATAVLKRHGLVTPRKLRHRKPIRSKPHIEAAQPNDLWTADFKGEFRTGDRRLCYPLTLADYRSRFLLECRGRRSTARAPARPVFEQAFVTYGLPRAILTDGGPPFSCAATPRRLSRLAVWWIKLGIGVAPPDRRRRVPLGDEGAGRVATHAGTDLECCIAPKETCVGGVPQRDDPVWRGEATNLKKVLILAMNAIIVRLSGRPVCGVQGAFLRCERQGRFQLHGVQVKGEQSQKYPVVQSKSASSLAVCKW